MSFAHISIIGSQSGPQTSTGIIWELGHANSQVLSQIYRIRNFGGGPNTLRFNKPSRCF